MNRETTLPILFAIGAVVAIALGAATLNTTVRSSDQPSEGGSLFGEQSSQSSLLDWHPPSTISRLFIVLYVLFLLIGGYVLYRIYGIEFYVILVLGFVCTLIVLWLTNTQATFQGYTSEIPLNQPMSDSSTANNSSPPPSYLYLIIVAGILIATGILTRSVSSGGTFSGDGSTEDDATNEQSSALGAAAGRAANRIESQSDPDTSNEVYRAWYDMTQFLSVPRPASSTPAQFADAAVKAGIRRQDVTELTQLFEAARYSNNDITDQQEATAIAVLRRIEEQYGDGEKQ